jgi:hypothetical protein
MDWNPCPQSQESAAAEWPEVVCAEEAYEYYPGAALPKADKPDSEPAAAATRRFHAGFAAYAPGN